MICKTLSFLLLCRKTNWPYQLQVSRDFHFIFRFCLKVSQSGPNNNFSNSYSLRQSIIYTLFVCINKLKYFASRGTTTVVLCGQIFSFIFKPNIIYIWAKYKRKRSGHVRLRDYSIVNKLAMGCITLCTLTTSACPLY